MNCVSNNNKLHSAPSIKDSVGVLCCLKKETDLVWRVHGVVCIMRCGNMIIVSWPFGVSQVCTHCAMILLYIPCRFTNSGMFKCEHLYVRDPRMTTVNSVWLHSPLGSVS